MNQPATQPIAAPSAADHGDDQSDAVPTANERLCHLFRDTLKNGRIHPLYLPLLRYRHARATP